MLQNLKVAKLKSRYKWNKFEK